MSQRRFRLFEVGANPGKRFTRMEFDRHPRLVYFNLSFICSFILFRDARRNTHCLDSSFCSRFPLLKDRDKSPPLLPECGIGDSGPFACIRRILDDLHQLLKRRKWLPCCYPKFAHFLGICPEVLREASERIAKLFRRYAGADRHVLEAHHGLRGDPLGFPKLFHVVPHLGGCFGGIPHGMSNASNGDSSPSNGKIHWRD